MLAHCPFQAHGELRDHVVESHIGPIDIVRPKDQHPFEMLAAVIDDHHFADDLAGAVGQARIERIGNHERCAFVGRHAWRRLIDFRARGENELSNAVTPAGIDDVDDALHTNVEHEIGRAVERRRTVHEGEMMHLVDAAHGRIDVGGVADVTADELDVALDLSQPAQGATGIIIEHAHRLALAHEPRDQGRAEKATAAGDQNAPYAHSPAVPCLLLPPAYHIGSADGKPRFGPYRRG
jgi:hypothetical protein